MKRSGLALITFAITLQLIIGCKGREETHPPHPSSSRGVSSGNLSEVDALEKIVKRDPGNLKAQIMLGNLYFDTGRNEEAVRTYGAALTLSPDNPDVRTDMGICLRRLKRTDEAIEAFRRASASDPGHYQSRYNLGLTLLHDKNDLSGAIDAWEELLRTVPEFPGRERLSQQVKVLKEGSASPGGSGFKEFKGK